MRNPRALVRGAIGLELLAERFTSPVALADPGDGRLFVVDQIGRIYAIHPDRPQQRAVFLDVTERLVRLNPGYDERGLLGLAFHPRFEHNGRFFVFYSAPPRAGAPPGWNCTSRLAEYRVSGDPDRADAASERLLMAIDKPQPNHNGGHICFGPDGYLYISLGDGGGANDRGAGHNPAIGNGQDTHTPLGKILRIDVDREEGERAYGIPPDNPFVRGGGLPEIFAYGLRNPYHIAFDAGGDRALFTGDVGQNRWEEVDIVVRGGNYGWNIREGMHCFNPHDGARCYLGSAGEELIDPILEYPNLSNRMGGIGSAVIGGYVYRGSAIPFLRGRYVFGDYTGSRRAGAGRIFVGIPPAREGGRWTMDALEVDGRVDLGEYVLAFGEDADRELYLLSSEGGGPSDSGGRVYRIVPRGGRGSPP